jgi:flagellar basal body-associated protein FliL
MLKTIHQFPFKYSWVLVIGMVLSITIGGTASAAEKKKEAQEWVQPTHVHMIPMMVPVGNTAAPMTFIFEPVKKKQVEDICERMPRIRDALLRTFSRKPIPVKNRKIILKGVDKRILKPINKAVGERFVKKVHLFRGVVRLGQGKIKRNHFAVIEGCENILRSEREREQAKKTAQ